MADRFNDRCNDRRSWAERRCGNGCPSAFVEEHVPEYSEWYLDDSIVHNMASPDEAASVCSFDGDTPAATSEFHEEAEIVELALANARDRFAHLPWHSNFSIDVRGGQGTFKRFGVASDYLQASATSGTPEACCTVFSLHKSASFKLSLYTDDICGALAEGWASKMQTVYTVWQAYGFATRFKYLPCHLAWEEPASFQAIAFSAAPHVLNRVRQILEFWPR